MPFIRERHLFMTAIRVLSVVYSGVLTSHMLVAVEALSLLADTEDFSTYSTQYVVNVGDAEIMVAFKAKCLQPLSTDMEKRRLMRNLVDAIDKSKRKYRLK